MKEQIDKLILWFKANKAVGIVLILAVIMIFFGRQVKSLLFVKRRIRHRRTKMIQFSPGVRHGSRKMREPLPRSVGMHKTRGGYPKYGGGIVPFKRNKDGSIKKAKFVAGTVAAHNYMRSLRKNR